MRRIVGILAASSAMLGAAGSVGAQPRGRVYAGAAIGAFRVSADAVDGSSTAGSILGGIAVTPWLDVEVDATFPTARFTRTYGGDALSLSTAPQGASREEIERFGIWLRVRPQPEGHGQHVERGDFSGAPRRREARRDRWRHQPARARPDRLHAR